MSCPYCQSPSHYRKAAQGKDPTDGKPLFPAGCYTCKATWLDKPLSEPPWWRALPTIGSPKPGTQLRMPLS